MTVSWLPWSRSQSEAVGALAPKLEPHRALAAQMTIKPRAAAGRRTDMRVLRSGGLALGVVVVVRRGRGGGDRVGRHPGGPPGPPVLEERRQVRAAQGARPVGLELGKDLRMQLAHPCPVLLWVPVVLLVVAVVEPEQVVEPVVGADRVGE